MDLVPRLPLNSVQMPEKASSNVGSDVQRCIMHAFPISRRHIVLDSIKDLNFMEEPLMFIWTFCRSGRWIIIG